MNELEIVFNLFKSRANVRFGCARQTKGNKFVHLFESAGIQDLRLNVNELEKDYFLKDEN
jgi:hypothetical protein